MTTPIDDIDNKKTFLFEGARLYDTMIRLTTSDVIRRYLAFRIIVNSMAFEDVVKKRSNVRFRQIRNTLLAHKQEPDFFAGYNANDEIKNSSISQLITDMSAATSKLATSYLIPELSDESAHKIFSCLMPRIFEKYNEDFLAGFRLINNHLCFTGSCVHEVSYGEIPGVFYRYHSSMALFQLAQYIYNNVYQNQDLHWTTRHSKLDMLLHAQNIADTVIKDVKNPYSIEGLLEIMKSKGLGNVSCLEVMKADNKFVTGYAKIRNVRNKLIGHMDTRSPLSSLLYELDALPVVDIQDLVNIVDKAVYDASQSDNAIRVRYMFGNQSINDSRIVEIQGFKPSPYF